ncbi:MAG: hypothetical protein JWO22_834 [Frankiales bacterium]|nr:hypothetical protein [Frankiales bacterium]
MQTISLEALPVVGASELESTADGLVVHRLPAWARAQCFEPMLALVERMPAGVRLSLHTDATELEFDVDLQIVALAERPPIPAVFDLVVNGEVKESVSTIVGTHLSVDLKGELLITPGPTETVRFENLPGDPSAVVEVWLPHAACVSIRAARLSDGATLSPAEPTGPRWIHYGSSISHCLEAVTPTQTWPNAVALRTGWNIQNIGLGGQCMLDQFAARTIRDLPADAITMKVGINIVNGDTLRERTFVPALNGFLDTVREGHPDTPIVLVTPIICPTAETAPGPTILQADKTFSTVPRPTELSVGALSLTRIRELVALVVTLRQDPNLHLLDGLGLFGEDDVQDLYDGLHPNAEGYLRMADRFFDQVCAPGKVLGALIT